MICKNCGAQNEEGSKFCEKCGKPMDNKEQKNATGMNRMIIFVCAALILVCLGVFIGFAIMGRSGRDAEKSTTSEEVLSTDSVSQNATDDSVTEETGGIETETAYPDDSTEDRVAFGADGSQHEYEEPDKTASIKHLDFKGVHAGQIVTFGRYEQDNNVKNGVEDIEWEVLCVDKDRALLISRYILDYKQYNEEYDHVNWKDCSLRKWLNNDFYYTAFDENEQKFILTTPLENEDNPYRYFGPHEKDTEDEVFCLSFSDLRMYYQIEDINTSTREADGKITDDNKYTQYEGRSDALIASATKYVPEGCNGWWLRTPGEDAWDTCYVFKNGQFSTMARAHCMTAVINDMGVRPAMWVAIKK